MKNREFILMALSFIAFICIALYIDFKVFKDSISRDESYSSEPTIHAYEKKKCRHINNNISCRWCREYRFDRESLKYYNK